MSDSGSARVPTIIDIARELGISKSVVARALSGTGSVKEETRQRVLETARRLGYVKNAMAQGLVAQRTRTIGVLVHDAASPFYGSLHAAAQRRAAERGYRVVTAMGNQQLADEHRALETLLSLRVDGLIVASGLLPTADIEPFVTRAPTVVAGRPEHGDLVGSVHCDEQDGPAQLVEHLMLLGHRTVAVLCVPESISYTMHLRSESMVERLRERGARPIRLRADPASLYTQPGVRSLLDRHPEATALMCPSDALMVGALEELRMLGADVPGRMSVTGYDGMKPLSAPFLGLTTLRQSLEGIGRHAVDALVELIDRRDAARAENGDGNGSGNVATSNGTSGLARAQHIVLTGTLVAGRTTGPATHLQ